MALSDELHPASFRGIPFLVRSSSITRGGKSVTHEYPNDDRRYVEPLGILKPTINLVAVITDINGDYINHRDIILEALDDARTGILINPWHGSMRVAPKPYTIEENEANLGECVINMVFEVADPPINPRQTNDQLSNISSLSGVLDGSLLDKIHSTFNVSKEYFRNFTAAKLKVGNVINSFNVFGSYFGASNNTNVLTSQQNNFSNNIVSAIKTPLILATSISGLFNAANDVNNDPEAIYSGMSSIFSFGNDDTPIDNITTETTERIINNAILTYSMQVYALIYAYQNAVQIDFNNDVQLEKIRQKLELQFYHLYNDMASVALGLSIYDLLGDEIFYNLQSLRDSCRLSFDQISISVDKIVNITVNTTPATIISYQYYGDVEEADDIISLNNLKDISFVSGDLQVITNADDRT